MSGIDINDVEIGDEISYEERRFIVTRIYIGVKQVDIKEIGGTDGTFFRQGIHIFSNLIKIDINWRKRIQNGTP